MQYRFPEPRRPPAAAGTTLPPTSPQAAMIFRDRQRGEEGGADAPEGVLRDRMALDPRRVLRFVYAGRLVVVLAVYGSALLVGGLWFVDAAPPDVSGEVQLLSLLGLAAAGVVTPIAYWQSHRRSGPVTRPFLLSQALLDVLLVTGVVHITGGSGSVFPPLLYVALVTAYALMLPVRHALLVVAGAGGAYVLDIALAYPELPDLPVLFQVAVFVGVTAASSYIGGRLRETRRELERMESALRRLRLNTIDVLHTLRSAVLTVDVDGRLAYLNPLAEELLDLPAARWIGRDVLPALQRRAPGLATAFRDTVRRESGVREREVEVMPPSRRGGGTDHRASRAGRFGPPPTDGASDGDGADGGPVPVAARTAYLARSGGTPTVTLVLQDQRPIRQLERLRRRTERLEAVTELSASLAHEIRNPLASIQSAAEQLSARAGDGGGAGEDELTELIVRESQRLDRLLGEFSDFAAMKISDRHPVDLERAVREAVEVVREHPETPDSARFTIRVEGFEDGELSGELWGDEDLLHRAFLNILLNAVQAWREDPGGELLEVEAVIDPGRPEIVPSEIAPGRPVRVRVIDNGPGIDDQEMDRVFDPFYSGREDGTGLGLSVAYRVARAHGGTLNARSERGEGAVFEFVLLRREPEARELLERDAPPSPHPTDSP